MGKFKSGIIFENEIILTPIYCESYTSLLYSQGIHDMFINSNKRFVKVALIPKDQDRMTDISGWEYVEYQNVFPDWYERNKEKYEKDFRDKVREWMKDNFKIICGHLCAKIKEDNNGTYYKTASPIFYSSFAADSSKNYNNNYATSEIRNRLIECDFAKALKSEFGNKLLPITLDLTSEDGLDDYGILEGDVLSLLNYDIYRECRKNIPHPHKIEWTATPSSTSTGWGNGSAMIIDYDGGTCRDRVYFNLEVSPFFILKN